MVEGVNGFSSQVSLTVKAATFGSSLFYSNDNAFVPYVWLARLLFRPSLQVYLFLTGTSSEWDKIKTKPHAGTDRCTTAI